MMCALLFQKMIYTLLFLSVANASLMGWKCEYDSPWSWADNNYSPTCSINTYTYTPGYALFVRNTDGAMSIYKSPF